MSVIQLIDFTMKIQEKWYLFKMSYLMKIKKLQLTDIQSKFYKLASGNEILRSKIIVAENTTKALQENLNSNTFKITELERSVHKLEQYSLQDSRECVEIAEILRDIPHVILKDVVIKLLNKIGVNLTKNDLVACHRVVNSDRTIIKVLNRKHAEQTINNNSINSKV